MTLSQILSAPIEKAILSLFNVTIDKVEFQSTRKEFEGDITMVIFPLLKVIKSNPVELGNKIGAYLVENVAEVSNFNVVSGFLNIVISDQYYLDFFNDIKDNSQFGFVSPKTNEPAVMVEYSSPNTNKPLHLGHVRNNLLGYSVAEILKASGKKVYKTQIINDRGIHICKSMLAWQKFGNGQTPQTSGLKGDKLVGNFYVAFDKAYKEEINQLISEGKSEEEVIEFLLKERFYETLKQLCKNSEICQEIRQTIGDWEMNAHVDSNYQSILDEFDEVVESEFKFTKEKREVTKYYTSKDAEGNQTRREYQELDTFYKISYNNDWIENSEGDTLQDNSLFDIFKEWCGEQYFTYEMKPNFSDYGDVNSVALNKDLKSDLERYLK